MVSLPIVRPYESPSCWGQKYQDGDIECGQCRHNDTCKKEVLRSAMNAPMPGYAPLPTRAPAWPAPTPAPSTSFRTAPPPPPMHQISQYQQPIPVPVTPLYPTGYQATPHAYHLPLEVPDPMQPWARPGATAQPYYFNQYPGERPVERFAKNMVLRAIAAMAQEFLGFFVQWTWPPSRSNNKQG